MDLVDAMNLWFKMGGDTAIEDKGKGKPYITHFVWNGNVEGHFTAVPGSFNWNWPQRLLDKFKASK